MRRRPATSNRLTITSLMGTVRALYPGDRVRQDIIFPESSGGSPIDAEEDDDTDPVTPAEG